MEKLMQSTQIQHSSHPHLLQLSSNIHLQNQPHPINCSGCDLHISSSDHHIYTCTPCNFFLHSSCTKFPKLITDPAHPQHTLSLLPSCIYPGGFFQCDACTQQGNRFSYHCQICDFDLHVLCTSKPLLVSHPLQPTFTSPYGEKVGFSCDLCRNVGSGHRLQPQPAMAAQNNGVTNAMLTGFMEGVMQQLGQGLVHGLTNGGGGNGGGGGDGDGGNMNIEIITTDDKDYHYKKL